MLNGLTDASCERELVSVSVVGPQSLPFPLVFILLLALSYFVIVGSAAIMESLELQRRVPYRLQKSLDWNACLYWLRMLIMWN